MELSTIIYTTNKRLWVENELERIYEIVGRAPGVQVKPFKVVYFELPDNVKTKKSGNAVRIDWDWLKENCSAEGHKAICLHISRREHNKLGLRHPNGGSLGGSYNRDRGRTFEFFVVADRRDKSYHNMSGFQRKFVHELSHGFSHFRSVTDYTHTWDYTLKNIDGAYYTHDFTRYNALYTRWQELRKQLADLMSGSEIVMPLEPQFMDDITQKFGVPNANYPTTRHHVGTDWGVPEWEECFAIADGRITRVYKNHPTLGNACQFQFEFNDGLYTARYLHLAQAPKEGAYKKGDRIGYTGNTGDSTGPHLHLDIVRGEFDLTGVNAYNFRNKFVDPEVLLALR